MYNERYIKSYRQATQKFDHHSNFIRSTGSRIVVPSPSVYTFEQIISNLNGLPTIFFLPAELYLFCCHNSIANIFDAILDVVSLKKSKEFRDELPNNKSQRRRVMLKQCNLLAIVGSNLARYCITRLTHFQSLL